jgi:intracellular sulfur oxidation DsrE/DsrF family protein
MKKLVILSLLTVLSLNLMAQGQKWVNPIIPNYGRIIDLENVDIRPDPEMTYNILIEVVHDMEKPERLNFYANNVARLINLHAVGGVKKENLNIVVVIHAQATNTVVNNAAYMKKYEVDSPYVNFYKELVDAGVELIVCGQSLQMFGHQKSDVLPGIKVATSALTAISTYQLKGYAFFKMG